eukprot:4985443-Prymnesium_polylepis.1
MSRSIFVSVAVFGTSFKKDERTPIIEQNARPLPPRRRTRQAGHGKHRRAARERARGHASHQLTIDGLASATMRPRLACRSTKLCAEDIRRPQQRRARGVIGRGRRAHRAAVRFDADQPRRRPRSRAVQRPEGALRHVDEQRHEDP